MPVTSWRKRVFLRGQKSWLLGSWENAITHVIPFFYPSEESERPSHQDLQGENGFHVITPSKKMFGACRKNDYDQLFSIPPCKRSLLSLSSSTFPHVIEPKDQKRIEKYNFPVLCQNRVKFFLFRKFIYIFIIREGQLSTSRTQLSTYESSIETLFGLLSKLHSSYLGY